MEEKTKKKRGFGKLGLYNLNRLCGCICYTQPDLKQARGLKSDPKKREGTQRHPKKIYTEYFRIGIAETP